MRFILDHHGASVATTHHHGTTSVEGTTHHLFDRRQLLGGCVAKGQCQNSRVRTKRDTNPWIPDVDELDVPEVPVKAAPVIEKAQPLGTEPPRCSQCEAGVPHDHPADPGGDEARVAKRRGPKVKAEVEATAELEESGGDAS